MKLHKPGCMANMQCLVDHLGAACPGPYGKCTCGVDAVPSSPDTRCCTCNHYEVKPSRHPDFVFDCVRCGLPRASSIKDIPVAREKDVCPCVCVGCMACKGYYDPHALCKPSQPEKECEWCSDKSCSWCSRPQRAPWSERFDETDFGFVMNAEPMRKLKSFIADVEAAAEKRGRDAACDYIKSKSRVLIDGVYRYIFTEESIEAARAAP